MRASEEEILAQINLLQDQNQYLEGYKGKQKAINRLSSMVQPKAVKYRQATVVDINSNTEMPEGQ